MSTLYAIKIVHIATALVTIAGFVIRGYWRLNDSPTLQQRWLRIAPHVNDTVLLASGIFMAWRLGQYPFEQPWLTAKLVGLFVYILLGLGVMRFARRRLSRFAAYVLAIVTFIYIIAVALTRSVIPAA